MLLETNHLVLLGEIGILLLRPQQDDQHRALKDKGIVDSGCSRHMTGNKAHLADYQEFKGGSIAFGGSNGRITGKGKIKTGRLKGIKREYSNARTQQQNGVAKRKNKTLIKAARTILADSFLPTTFWAEAVNIGFYVLNRVLVTKPQNKTPYELLTVENQANKSTGPKEANNSVGTQANDDQGANSEEIDLNEEYFVLPIWSAYSTIVKSSGDKIEKNNGFKTCEKLVSQVEQFFLEELKKLKRQEKEANDVAESLRKVATHDIQNASTSSTNLINTASTLLSTAGPSRAFNNGELSYPDPSNYVLLDDPSMPHLKDIYAYPSKGIFTDSSYDDEGVVTDFNNLETTVSFNLTPTTRIHTIHPKTQILKDPKSAIQTKSKVNKNYDAYALISQSLKDKSWVDALQEELLQFQIQKGHRQEEWIDYDEVFAPVARIEAIRIFLAFASYMGFIVYQMDVKSAFRYGTIDKEVYVSQPPSFVDPKFPNKKSWCDEFEELMKNSVTTASTLIETHKPLVKDEEAADVDVTPKTSHLHDVKRIFRYLKGQTKLGLWYPKVSSFDLEEYSDSDYAGTNLDRKSTTEATLVKGRLTETTAKVKTINDEVRIQALINEKRVNIKESSIHRTLKLDDAEDTSCLANVEIFDGLAKMGYEKLFEKLTFYKAFFSPQWKFLIHIYYSASVLKQPLRMNLTALWHQQSFVLLQIRSSTSQGTFYLLGDMPHHKDIYDNLFLTKKVFANMKRVGTSFSGLISIPTKPSTSKPYKKYKPKKQQTQAPKVPSPEPSPEHRLPSPSNDPLPGGKDSLKLKELMGLCTYLPNKVLELESKVIDIKSTYKERIEKLEGREKSFKQGRIIADIDEDVEINLEEAQAKPYMIDLEHPKKVFSMHDVDDEEPAKVEEVLTTEEVNEEVIVPEKEVEVEGHKIEETTPLASKILIVDYTIHLERNKPYFKIIRVVGIVSTGSVIVNDDGHIS
nr:hypothetical protein [Tanacetum cinerariifolium]